MRTIVAIGIGTGNPAHLTVQAVDAMRSLDVVILLDKGSDTDDMRALRTNMLAEHRSGDLPEIVAIEDTPRDPELARRDYRAAVAEWHERRANKISDVMHEKLDDGGVAGFLVWGDPSLYDSTLRMLERVREAGQDFEVRSIPGIAAPMALCAAFAIPANRVGEPIHITTGRKLPGTAPELLRNCFVMLDGGCAFRDVAAEDTEIYWGAYLGDPWEIRIHGRVGDVGAEIAEARERARAEHGWIMDTYLLRAP